MKKIRHVYLLIGLIIMSGHLMAQKKVSIKGEVFGYSPQAVIYFMYADIAKQLQLIDSVKLKDGKFEKSISISEPTQLGMIMSPEGKSINTFTVKEQKAAEAISFYIDKGELNLKFDGAFAKVKIDPPIEINEDYKVYNAIITKDRQTAIDSINTHYAQDGKVNDDGTINLKAEQVEEYKLAIANAEQQVMNKLLVFTKANKDSYIGLLAMSSSFNAQPSLAPQLSEMLNDYTSELQNTTLGKKLRLELEMSR